MRSQQACQGAESLQSPSVRDLSECVSVKEQMDWPRPSPDLAC